MVGSAQHNREAGRADHANGTRQRILDAARELFAQHGYAGTSIRMIARHCGISDPTIHYHFRDKAEIYEALLVPPPYTEEPPPASIVSREALAAFMERRFSWWAGNTGFARLLLREQLRGRPGPLDYLADSERRLRAELSAAAAGLYGDAARIVSDLAWHLLAGALWDVVMTYGSDAPGVVEQEYFRNRIRTLIDAALDAGERCRA